MFKVSAMINELFMFQEGLSVGLHAPSVFGNRGILVASLRAKRALKENGGKAFVTLEFDDREKIHSVTEKVVAVEVHKPAYLTRNGVVPISLVFQKVSDFLKTKEATVNYVAGRLQAAVQEKIVNDLDVSRELIEFEEDFLLATPMKYPDLKVERTVRDTETATINVYGKVLTNGNPFEDTLTLPSIRFMVCGLDLKKGKTVPDFFDVSIPGRIKKITGENVSASAQKEIGFSKILATDMYDEVSLNGLLQALSIIPECELPLSLEEATKLVSDCIAKDIKNVLKLEPDHPIPVEFKMLNS